jgi:hypothetical protein
MAFQLRKGVKKYCKIILYRDNIIPENIILLASQLKIPIKEYSVNGLNNLIDIIEK